MYSTSGGVSAGVQVTAAPRGSACQQDRFKLGLVCLFVQQNCAAHLVDLVRIQRACVLASAAPFMAFFQRLFSYLVNEALVNGLANNRTFQRFAIRSNEMFNDLSKKGALLLRVI